MGCMEMRDTNPKPWSLGGSGFRILGFTVLGLGLGHCPPPSNCPERGLIKGVLITPITHCGNSYCKGE